MPANPTFITVAHSWGVGRTDCAGRLVGIMRIFWTMAAAMLCCVGTLKSAFSAEEHLGLRGQLYFEPAPDLKPPQDSVPRHIPSKHVARAPIDFSYPETAASTGSHILPQETRRPREESPWQLDLTDGAKLRFAYDKDTKLKLGMGMWKVKVGVSKAFGGPSNDSWELPVRQSRAASLGRAGGTERGHPLN